MWDCGWFILFFLFYKLITIWVIVLAYHTWSIAGMQPILLSLVLIIWNELSWRVKKQWEAVGGTPLCSMLRIQKYDLYSARKELTGWWGKQIQKHINAPQGGNSCTRRMLICCCCKVASVMSDSVRPHLRQPTRLLCPWDSLGKNTGMGCQFLLQCMLACWVASVVSDSVRPHGQQPTRLLCPRDSPGKNTGVGCHCHTYLITRQIIWVLPWEFSSRMTGCCDFYLLLPCPLLG